MNISFIFEGRVDLLSHGMYLRGHTYRKIVFSKVNQQRGWTRQTIQFIRHY